MGVVQIHVEITTQRIKRKSYTKYHLFYIFCSQNKVDKQMSSFTFLLFITFKNIGIESKRPNITHKSSFCFFFFFFYLFRCPTSYE